MPDAEIFFSHSTKDDAIVTRIHDALESRTGQSIWVDHEDIAPGDHWQEEIELHLKTCPRLLLAISRQSVKSREVTAEWRAALTYNHPMLLAVIDDIPVEDIPSRLRLIQWVNLHTDWDGGITALANAIMGKRGDESPLDAPDFKLTWPITGDIERKLTAIPMTGRENELAEVKRKLTTRPVSILGVGGLGKSRLAAEVAMTHDAIGGAIWHRASATSTPEGVYLLLADHFHLDPATPCAEILNRLNTHSRLVILDNAEDVPPDDPRHADYLGLVETLATHKVQVLLTSRLEWEAVQPGAVVLLHPLPLTEAAQVVIAMATAFDVDVKLIEPQAEHIARAARQHPRLIEWAVRQMKRFPVDEIVAELNTLNSRETQKALDEMIGRTYRKMVDSGGDGKLAEIALSRLLPCRGGFTLDAAKALVIPPRHEGEGATPGVEGADLSPDDLRAALTTLMNWQLVAYDQTRGRYTIDPLVLTAADAGTLRVDETAYHAHFDYYKALAETHREKQDYLGLDPESGNLDAAFEWAMRSESHENALDLFNALIHFLANRGRFSQRLDWIELVVAALGDHANKELLGNAQISLGIVYRNHPLGSHRDNLSRAIAAFEAALVYWTSESAPLNYAMTQDNLGIAYRNLAAIEDRAGNLSRATNAFKTALVYRTPDAVPLDYAATQNNLGAAYSDLAQIEDRAGNLSRAIAAFKAALAYRTPDAVPLEYAATQNNLGIAYAELSTIEDRTDNLLRAITVYQAALVYYTPEAAPLNYAAIQNNLGVAYRFLSAMEDRTGNLSRSITAYQAALIYRTLEASPLGYALTQANLGLAYRDLDNLPAAIVCWREAEKYYRQTDYVDNADKILEFITTAEAQLNAGSSGSTGPAGEGE